MDILVALGLTLVNAAWVALTVLGLPGTWLIAASTAAAAWLRWDAARAADEQFVGLPVLVALLLLAAAGEVVEFVAGAAGARRAGGSRLGSLGALLGALVGGLVGTIYVPIPIVGSLAGACGGAAAGAWALELWRGRSLDDANRIGLGAGVGRLQGLLGKLAIAATMWVLATVAAFWP